MRVLLAIQNLRLKYKKYQQNFCQKYYELHLIYYHRTGPSSNVPAYAKERRFVSLPLVRLPFKIKERNLS